MPGAQSARSLACENLKAHERSHYGHTGFTRHSPRDGFNAFLRALPGDRACLPPSQATMRSIVACLTSASRCQDHTTSPSAGSAIVSAPSASTASPLTFVTIAKRPLLKRRDDSL